MSTPAPLSTDLQQKAQKLRAQAHQAQSAPGLDGFDIAHLVDGALDLLNSPAPNFSQVSEQLSGLAETIQNALPENLDASDLLQPVLEGIGDLLGSLGDLSS